MGCSGHLWGGSLACGLHLTAVTNASPWLVHTGLGVHLHPHFPGEQNEALRLNEQPKGLRLPGHGAGDCAGRALLSWLSPPAHPALAPGTGTPSLTEPRDQVGPSSTRVPALCPERKDDRQSPRGWRRRRPQPLRSQEGGAEGEVGCPRPPRTRPLHEGPGRSPRWRSPAQACCCAVPAAPSLSVALAALRRAGV